jgi:hypothetical protein
MKNYLALGIALAFGNGAKAQEEGGLENKTTFENYAGNINDLKLDGTTTTSSWGDYHPGELSGDVNVDPETIRKYLDEVKREREREEFNRLVKKVGYGCSIAIGSGLIGYFVGRKRKGKKKLEEAF